jgi:hypothetical protein
MEVENQEGQGPLRAVAPLMMKDGLDWPHDKPPSSIASQCTRTSSCIIQTVPKRSVQTLGLMFM